MADAVTVDDLDVGDHVCLTFSDPDERLDLLAAFVRGGLRQRHKVICWTDALTRGQLADELTTRSVRTTAAQRRGQLVISTTEGALLSGSPPTVESMMGTLTEQLDQAGREGYPALRIIADMNWATKPLAAADELLLFETKIAELFADGRLCVICEYDRDRFDAVTLAFAAKAHPKAVAAVAYHDDVLLRICRQYSPPGVRIAGELDFRHLEQLNQALAESLRLDRNMFVNLGRLDYIDAACASAIVRTAVRLPPSRHMTVLCGGLVAKVLDVIGAGNVSQLHLRRTHDQR
jgi:hypothetical protein